MSEWTEKFQNDWQQRSASERMILVAVGLLVAVTLLYTLVLEPMATWQEQERKRTETNQRVLTQVNGLVNRIQGQTVGQTTAAKGLAGVIDSSLQKQGLTMRGFQPGKKNDARLRLSNVAYEPVVEWLHELEHTHRLTIEELTMSQAKTKGLLMVNLRVSQR